MALLPNGYVASGGDDNKIIIWNPVDGSVFKTLNDHIDSVRSLAVLKNGNLISGSRSIVIIWDSIYQVTKSIAQIQWVFALAVLPDSGNFAAGLVGGTIQIFTQDGSFVRTLTGHSGNINALFVLPDGDLVSGSDDTTIRIWNSDGTVKRVLAKHTSSVTAFDVQKNGYLVSAARDNTVKVWNITDGQLKTDFNIVIVRLKVLPNGDFVTAQAYNIIITSPSGQIKFEPASWIHSSFITELLILPNGYIASASSDRTVKIWAP
jgi:WD40 repeat protein